MDMKHLDYMRNIDYNAGKAEDYKSAEKKGMDFPPHYKQRYEMFKDRSPRSSMLKKEYELSLKDRRDGGFYRGRRESPRRYDSNRSLSPSRKYKYPSEKEKYLRRSPSPRFRRRSRSPHPHRSRSPVHSRRHSRSPPHYRRSPRDERAHVAPLAIKSGHRSTSYEKSHMKRRSASPYSKQRSRSPHESRRSSRSPTSQHSDPRRQNHTTHSPTKRIYKHPPEEEYVDYQYYGAEGGYWIPGPMHRPGFVPRGAIPQHMFMPRGGPYMMPRPYVPMQPPFRPRFPYNSSHKPRFNAIATTSTTTTTSTSITPSTSSTDAVPAAEPNSAPTPIIVEVSDSAEKADSTVAHST